MTSPKFSVLLPTRNRLDLAKGAIETVRLQSFDNWELIVADNCSIDDVRGYLVSLNDPRIIYTRSEVPLSVTDNWNRAVDMSRGDWVVMLGDDDGLAPNYFNRISEIIDHLGEPDFLQQGAFNFLFPGISARYPNGALFDELPFVKIMRGQKGPALLTRTAANQAALQSISLHSVFSLGAPYNIFSRRIIDKIKKQAGGGFYQSPFPDFFIVMIAMLLGDRVGVVPERLIIRGTSKNSFSHFAAQRDTASGIEYLKIESFLNDVPDEVRSRLLPGPMMNTGWLLAGMYVKQLLPHMELQLPIMRYRLLQMFEFAKSEVEFGSTRDSREELNRQLNIFERIALKAMRLGMAPARFLRGKPQRAWIAAAQFLCQQYPVFPSTKPQKFHGVYSDMADVYQKVMRLSPPGP